jgi:hypothetical protein
VSFGPGVNALDGVQPSELEIMEVKGGHAEHDALPKL